MEVRRRYFPSFYSKLGIHAILIVGVVFMVLPFLLMAFSSFKLNAEIMKVPITFLPKKWILENYQKVFERNIFQAYQNTIIVAVLIVVSQLLTGSMAAYAFARLDFPLKRVLFLFVLALCMIPSYMTLIPRYRMLSNWGLANTLMGIVLPNSVSITVVFFLRQNFLAFPKELEESAKIDGAGYTRIFATMVVPLQRTALSAMGVLVLLFAWNDLLWPNIIINSEHRRVLSIFVANCQGARSTEFGFLMAAGCIAILPMIVVYAFGQKAFMASVAMSGIKE